jgi:hypothetical protein
MAVWGPGTGVRGQKCNQLFGGILHFAGVPPAGLIFLTFGIAAITVINVYKVRFCDNCGATTGLFRKGILHDATCPKCEAPLRWKR